MLRLKSVVVLGVLAGVMAFGAMVAQGSWWWNSTVDVEGHELRTVWEVLDETGCAYCYEGDVVVWVPKKANASVVEVATNETVRVRKTKNLSCTSEGIEVQVDATVDPLAGATGSQAQITLIVDGLTASVSTGAVGAKIKQTTLIEGATC